LYVVRAFQTLLDGETRCSINRDILQEQLNARGIQTGIHYPLPCHLQPAFRNLGYRAGDFPIAEMLCQEIFSLPMYPGLTEEHVIQVMGAIEEVLATPSSLQLSA
jgi:dTDP-4-amino-4,6-dideoxygalactose transaminase